MTASPREGACEACLVTFHRHQQVPTELELPSEQYPEGHDARYCGAQVNELVERHHAEIQSLRAALGERDALIQGFVKVEMDSFPDMDPDSEVGLLVEKARALGGKP
jgi:hypothetical protein